MTWLKAPAGYVVREEAAWGWMLFRESPEGWLTKVSGPHDFRWQAILAVPD